LIDTRFSLWAGKIRELFKYSKGRERRIKSRIIICVLK